MFNPKLIVQILVLSSVVSARIFKPNAPNPCRAGEKRDLASLPPVTISGPWRLFQVCIFQSDESSGVNSSVEFTYIDKNPGTQITTHCGYQSKPGPLVIEDYLECDDTSISWKFNDAKFWVERIMEMNNIANANVNEPDADSTSSVMSGFALTNDWARTNDTEGVYIHRNYQEITASTVE